MKSFKIISSLFLISFSMSSIADIVHFDNSKCDHAISHGQAYSSNWRNGPIVDMDRWASDAQINTGDHIKSGELFYADFDFSGDTCQFFGNGGHHFVRTKNRLLGCGIESCEG